MDAEALLLEGQDQSTLTINTIQHDRTIINVLQSIKTTISHYVTGNNKKRYVNQDQIPTESIISEEEEDRLLKQV